MQQILSQMSPIPTVADNPDTATARRSLVELVQQLMTEAPDYTGVRKETIQIPVRDGTSIPAILYRPEQPPANGSPLIVMYHAGGFCIGFPEMEEPVILHSVRCYGAVAISVDYRMASEHIFPTAIHDSYDALKWVSWIPAIINSKAWA